MQDHVTFRRWIDELASPAGDFLSVESSNDEQRERNGFMARSSKLNIITRIGCWEGKLTIVGQDSGVTGQEYAFRAEGGLAGEQVGRAVRVGVA